MLKFVAQERACERAQLEIQNIYTNDIIPTVYKELKEQHFDRQTIDRRKIYDGIIFSDVLSEISDLNIQYIMTKQIATWYYEEIHRMMKNIDPSITSVALTSSDIESIYIDNINSLADLFACHISMIDEIRRL